LRSYGDKAKIRLPIRGSNVSEELLGFKCCGLPERP
jgi:hypothetical protein